MLFYLHHKIIIEKSHYKNNLNTLLEYFLNIKKGLIFSTMRIHVFSQFYFFNINYNVILF